MNSIKKAGYAYTAALTILSFVFALVGVILIYEGTSGSFYLSLPEGLSVKAVINILREIPIWKLLLQGTVIFLLTFGIGMGAVLFSDTFGNFLYKYRYVIGLVVLVVCVIFELSGSSISYFASLLPNAGDTDTLFHSANNMRSDEFAVNTVLAIAQDMNINEKFPYFSDVVRGTSTDMFIVYGQPVMSYGIIFRPFQIGYLLFGSSRGLSFFWCARMIVLVLVSFEFGMMLTKGKKALSVFYSLFLSFSPLICWWFAINGLVEMFVFGQLCALMLDKYMNTDSIKKKILCSLVFFWSGGCYILVFYPAWQVIMGYVFLVIFIWVICKNRKTFKWSFKKDLPIILITGAIVGALLLSLLLQSFDTIMAVLNTAYPGQRVSTDKFSFKELFQYGYSLFLPIVEGSSISPWPLIDLFPVGIILSLIVIFYEKKKDWLLIALVILQVFLIVIYTCDVPVVVLKLSLLSMVPSFRAINGIQLINLLLLFRAVTLMEKKKIAISAAAAVYYAILACAYTKEILYVFGFTRFMQLLVVAFFSIAAFAFIGYRKSALSNLILAGVAGIIILDGIMVNPVQKGLDFIFENELVQSIREISEEDNVKWIVDEAAFPANNIPLFAGVETINCTNVYPQLDTWYKLDSEKKFEEYYNRYAHITVHITKDEETKFELLYPDQFKVILNSNDLDTLDVSYILTTRELEEMATEEVAFERINSCGDYKIYKLTYED